jgi:hypothetical protein
MAGDVVYADTKHFPMFWEPSPVSVMKAKYDAQKARPAYHNFSSSTPIIGTWVRRTTRDTTHIRHAHIVCVCVCVVCASV